MVKSIVTTNIEIQLGTAFWLLVAVTIAGLVLWSILGSERMAEVIRGGVEDTFG